MPWTKKQKKVLNAIKHGWKPPAGAPFEGMSQKKAAMEAEKPTRRKKAEAQAKALGKERGLWQTT